MIQPLPFTVSKSTVNQSVIAALLVLGCAAAQAQESPWRFYAGLGLADGGDTVVSGVIVTDVTNKQTPFIIKAGEGFQMRAGMEYRLSNRFTVQGSVGYAISDPMGYNGSFTFTNIPVEAMAFVQVTEGFRLGAGLRKSTASLTGTGVAKNASINGDYTSSVGQVLEAQYLFGSPANNHQRATSSQFGVSVRLVREEFSYLDAKLKGDHYEVGAALYF